MGGVAEMILDGILCQTCGVFIGGETGYARSCSSCDPSEQEDSDDEDLEIDHEVEFCCECTWFPISASSAFCPMIKKKVKRLTSARYCEFAE
jgi:hypothetical protein